MHVTKIEATSQKKAITRYAAYARVSRHTEEQLLSFASQLRYYSNMFKESENSTLIELYADEGITGTDLNKRDDFKRMLADARLHKFDRIICKSVTRFARNTKDCLSAIRELKSLGISVYFEENRIDTQNLAGEALITLLGLSAQNESMSISKNERWSIRNRMANGTYVSYHAPFGYKFVGKEMKISEENAEIVKRIFRDFLNGKSIMQISKELDAETDEKWGYTRVRVILTNEKYTGDSIFQKNYTTDTLPFTVKKNKGEVPMYHVANTHEGIISREDFQKAQNLISERGKHHRGKPRDIRPLTRRIRCGECGSLFRKIEQNRKISWECDKRNDGKELCPIHRLPEDVIYDAFIQLFNKLKTNYKTVLNPVVYQLEKVSAKQKVDNVQAVQLQSEISSVREQNYQLSRFGLCADNFFKIRLKETPSTFKYDFPPYVLFDQKATLVLPFWNKTRNFFTDEIRNIIIFSTPLLSETIELEGGECVTIKEFSSRPPSQRAYYLKYAGSDVSKNWGSRAVYRLSNETSKRCEILLQTCLNSSKNGHIWLLQKELASKSEIEYWDRTGTKKIDKMNVKYSAFYGPFDLIGISGYYRKHFKVHGQHDTILNLIVSK